MRTITLAGRLRRTCWKYSFLMLPILPAGGHDRTADEPVAATGAPGLPRHRTDRPDDTGPKAAARVAPVIAPIGVQGNPHVDNPLVFGAAFTDIDRRDAHLALWSWGDGSQAPASVHCRNGAGSIQGRHAYRKAGVYTVRLTVLDSGGKRATATRQVVVRRGGQLTGAGDSGAAPDAPRATTGGDGAATVAVLAGSLKTEQR